MHNGAMKRIAALMVAFVLVASASATGGYFAHNFRTNHPACDSWTRYLDHLSTSGYGSSNSSSSNPRPLDFPPQALAFYKDAFTIRNAACKY